MLETYGVPFPVDNSSLDTEDTEDTEESDWWKRGPGGELRLAAPPAATLARQGNLPPGRVIPGTECKK
jgi:hypothetical protein